MVHKTLEQLAGEWCGERVASWGRAWSGKAHVLDKFLEYWHNAPTKMYPEDFVSSDINLYFSHLKDRGFRPSTRAHARNILQSFWRWMFTEKHAHWNPVSRTATIHVPPPRPAPLLDDNKIAALLGAAQSTKEKLLILLPLTAGVRPGSLTYLQWADLETLLLREDVQSLVSQLRQETAKIHGSKAVFEWGPRAVAHHWNRLCCQAGIGLLPLRSLRRTYEDKLLVEGTWGRVPRVT